MTGEGAIYFIVIIGAVVALIGAGVEILTLSAKNPKIKYIPIAVTGALFLITGFSYGYFTDSATILFGLFTAEEILVLLVWLLVKKLKKQR